MSATIEVIKLGGSVLRGRADLDLLVEEAERARARGQRVVFVVSAFAGTTDRLCAEARQLASQPDAASVVRLLATGEITAAALAVIRLCAAGFLARGADALDLGLRAAGSLLEGHLVDVDCEALWRALREVDAVVIPGFFARGPGGTPHLLGRGGSDQTALFLAHRLAAPCRLIKDTGALFRRDPRLDPTAQRFRRASWRTLLSVGDCVVQPAAVRFAERHGVCFALAPPTGPVATEIGPGPDELDPAPSLALGGAS